MKNKSFSIHEALHYGWDKTEEYLWFYVPLLLGVFVIVLGINWLQNAAQNTSLVAEVLFNVIGLVVSTIIAVGFATIALKIHSGKKVVLRDFFEKTHLWLPYLIASVVGALIFIGGLFLFVVPGVIWLVRFKFFGYFVVEHGDKPIDALKKSLAVTRGYTWTLCKFFATLIAINLLGVIPLGLGLFVTIPTSMLAFVHVYKKLSFHTTSHQ